MLFSSSGNLEPLFIAQYVPQYFWNSLPLDQLEDWIKAHSPAEMSSNIAKGMEGARFKVAEKHRLVPPPTPISPQDASSRRAGSDPSIILAQQVDNEHC
jgi:hypothetical protein